MHFKKYTLLLLLFSSFHLTLTAQQQSFELIFPSSDSSLTYIGDMADGKKNGLWTAFNEDSTYLQKGNYIEANKTGYWMIFYDRMEKARMQFKNNNLDGLYILFNNKGLSVVKTVFQNNQLNGEWTSFYDNGIKFENGNFKDGLKEGAWLSYDESGQPNIISYYEKGKLEGKFQQFDSFGQLMIRTNYKNGYLNGEWIKYDGPFAVEKGQFTEGERDGMWEYFEFSETQPSIKEFYRNGKKNRKMADISFIWKGST